MTTRRSCGPRLLTAALISAALGFTLPALAGMRPAATLTELAQFRLQTISFFTAILLVSAWIVGRLWNALRRDFPAMPRLSYGRSLTLVALWGLLFIVVLAMISGARELMTPGAWAKRADGGYRLANAPDHDPYLKNDDPLARRRAQLERLRDALWKYAQTHGRLPPDEFSASADIPEPTWLASPTAGVRYVYVPGRSIDTGDDVLAYEPGIVGDERLLLRTSGQIENAHIRNIREALSYNADQVTP